MAFVSWAVEYQRAKDALANKNWNDYFLSSVENHQQMRTTYTKLGNITSYIEWLGMMAQQETMAAAELVSGTAGAITFIIGGS